MLAGLGTILPDQHQRKDNDVEEWRRILAQSLVKPKDLADRLGIDPKEVEDIVGDYPMRITPTVLARDVIDHRAHRAKVRHDDVLIGDI